MPNLITLFIGWITQAFCIDDANIMEDQADIQNPIHFIYEENDWLALPPKATSVCLYNIEGIINDEFLNHSELESLRILTNHIELSDLPKLEDLKNLRALSISTVYPINKQILNHLPKSLEYVHLSNIDHEDIMAVLERLPDLMKFSVCLHPDTLSHQEKNVHAIFDNLDKKRREIHERFPKVHFSFFMTSEKFALTNPLEGIPDQYLPNEKED